MQLNLLSNYMIKTLIIKKENTDDILRHLTDAFDIFNITYDILDINDKVDINTKYDYIIALGGDGTIIKSSRIAIENNIPVLGINAGSLGFLSSVNANDDMNKISINLTENKYFIDKRSTLEVNILRNDNKVYENFCINEIEMSAKTKSHVGKFHIYIDNDILINDFSSDGLLISTPTGASGYAFSANSPIVSPLSKNVIITPIYPHAFNQRPFIIEDDKKICIDFDNNIIDILVDGNIEFEGKKDDKIIVKKGNKCLDLITFDKNMFYSKLRDKINTL